MPDTARSCPPPEALERYASGNDADPALADHLESCPKCRRIHIEILANNRFLDRFKSRHQTRGELAYSASGLITAADLIPGVRILGELHRGGQGVVYRGIHEKTDRPVAVKMMLQGSFATPQQRHRFEREIEIAAGLRHPHIVTLYETVSLPGGRLGYIMEFIEGDRMDRWSERITEAIESSHPPRVINRRLQLFQKIVSAVAYAHQRGVIHRDLKPANILIDKEDEPYLLDFGLARVIGDVPGKTITLTGEIVGTFAYAAPEQLSGDPHQIDTRTDVYALGVILYELLTGHHPYPVHGTMSEVIRHIRETEPERPRTFVPSLDGDLVTIMHTALAKDPDRRYANAGALSDDLRRYAVREPIDARRDSTWYVVRKTARRFRFPLTVAAGFLLLVTVFAVWMSVTAHNLKIQRDQLSDLLVERTIAQGRMLIDTGNVAAGEAALWNEYHRLKERGRSDEGERARLAHLLREARWGLWNLYARFPCLTTKAGHQGRVTGLDIHPDLPLLITAGNDRTLRLWSLPNLTLRAEQRVDTPVSMVRFVAGGEAIVGANSSGGLSVWDSELKQLHLQMTGHEGTVTALIPIPGTERFVTAGSDGGLLEWELGSATPLKTIYQSPDALISAALHPDGVTWTVLKKHTLLSVNPDSPEPELIQALLAPGLALLSAGDGSRVTVVTQNSIFQYDLSTFARSGPEMSINLENGLIAALPGSPRRLVLGRTDKSVQLINLDTRSVEQEFSGHDAPLTRLAILPDPLRIISTDQNGYIKVWETTSYQCYSPLGQHGISPHSIATNHNSHWLASGGAYDDPSIRVWDVESKKPGLVLVGHTDTVAGLAFLPANEGLISSSHDGSIREWDLITGECRRVIVQNTTALNRVDVNQQGTLLAAGNNDGEVLIWSRNSGSIVHTLCGHHKRIPSVRFDPSADRLASASVDGTIGIWNTITGKLIRVLENDGIAFRTLAWSPDGSTLAAGDDNWTISLWNPTTGECFARIEGNTAQVFALTFSPDSNLLASGGYENIVRLWDVETQRNLATIELPTNMVLNISFLDDGQRLAVCGAVGLLGILDLEYYSRHLRGNNPASISTM